jgi:hypothetical protein
VLSAAAAGVEGDQVLYKGGTLKGLSAGTIGTFDTTGDQTLVFIYGSGAGAGRLEIPYSKIDSYSYQRKLARHLGVAPFIALAMVKHPQHKHFLVIKLRDEQGAEQSAVFEISKEAPEVMLAVLSARCPGRYSPPLNSAQQALARGANAPPPAVPPRQR